jgi:hypothetical protein
MSGAKKSGDYTIIESTTRIVKRTIVVKPRADLDRTFTMTLSVQHDDDDTWNPPMMTIEGEGAIRLWTREMVAAVAKATPEVFAEFEKRFGTWEPRP